MSAELSVELSRHGDDIVVMLSGEVDMSTAPLVEKAAAAAVLEPDVVRVILDMSGISFLDSTGIGMLVRVRELANEQATRLVLRNVQPAVLRVLELVALATVFDLESTRD